jgi:hypothetical protein
VEGFQINTRFEFVRYLLGVVKINSPTNFGANMIAITELENHILELPRQDFAKLRDWMLALDDAKWDAQIASDFKAGKLNHLIAKARAETAAGTAKSL